MESTMDPLGVESDDHSILCRPIKLGTSGVQHILRGVQNGTPEVRNLLMNECDLIYECKICRSLHRSLANFIAHKRVYCTRHCCESMMLFNAQDTPEEYVVVVQPECPPDDSASAASLRDQLTTCTDPVPNAEDDLPRTIGAAQPTKICTTESSNNSDDIKIVADTLADRRRPVLPPPPPPPSQPDKPVKEWKQVLIKLEDIDENKNAVYQVVKREPDAPPARALVQPAAASTTTTTRRLARPISGKRKSPLKPSPVANHADEQLNTSSTDLDSDDDPTKEPFSCYRCGLKFTSLKTLTYHLKTIHSKHRVYFPCVYCTALFSQTWGVVRHLLTVHHKTKEQVNQLRKVIRRKAVQRARRDQDSSNEEEEEEEEEGDQEKEIKVMDDTNGTEEDDCDEATTEDAPAVLVTVDSKSCDRCDATFNDDDVAWKNHIKICRVQRKVTDGQRPPRLADSRQIGAPNGDGRPKRLVKPKLDDDFVSSDNIFPATPSTITNGMKLNSHSNSGNGKAQATLALKMTSLVDTVRRVCRECGAKFSRLSNLRRHAAGHAGYNRFKCKHCDFYTYARAECLKHIARKHPARGKRLRPEKLVVDLLAGGEEPSVTPSPPKFSSSTSTKRKAATPPSPTASRSKRGPEKPNLRELNSAIASASFKTILDRRGSGQHPPNASGGSSSSSSVASVGSKFNISTRMSPRTFDTSPYHRPDTLLASLRTRSRVTSK